MTATGRALYKNVAVELCEGGFKIALDGRAMRTPGGKLLALPSRSLADAVADEWRAQGRRPDPNAMPLTRLSASAIDRIGPEPDPIAKDIAAYGGTDLLLHRATEPLTLADSQRTGWQPWLDWLDRRFGIALVPTEGAMPSAQGEADLKRLEAVVKARDAFAMAALLSLTQGLGSVVLALAVADGALAAETAAELSQLDERYQAEKWGIDGLAERRRQDLTRQIQDAARFLGLCRE
jgi:chaperone required for assembly of F1-ATPase